MTCAGCGRPLVKRANERPSRFARRKVCDVDCRTRAAVGRINAVGSLYLIEDRGYMSPCWIWQRSTNPAGYGQKRVGGKLLPAHRWIYEREHGLLADGLELHHLCGVKPCVNPNHLEAVTRRTHNRLTKMRLTEDDVRAIRSSSLGNRKLAAIYGVHRSTILHVKAGRNWKDVV